MKWVFGGLLVLLLAWRGSALWTQAPATQSTPVNSGLAEKESEALALPQQLTRSTPPARSPMSIEFERAADLHAFVRQIASKADAGDQEALWMISRAVDYCAAYAPNPGNYTKTTDLYLRLAKAATSPHLKEARERVAARCRGFAKNSGDTTFTSAAYTVNRIRAARAGSLAGEASLLLMNAPLASGNEYLKNLVSRIQTSRDPEAYFALSESMGVFASGKESTFGSISGTQDSTYAWQLAACRLGLDCSPTGSTMTLYCAYGAACGNWTSFEDMVFRGMVAEGDRARINEMVNQILHGGNE